MGIPHSQDEEEEQLLETLILRTKEIITTVTEVTIFLDSIFTNEALLQLWLMVVMVMMVMMMYK